MPRPSFLLLSCLLFALLPGCAATAPPPAEVITVEGRIARRGNEPFTALMLATADRNLYVLTFDDGPVPDFSVVTRYRVTGRLYLDTWNSYRWAHLRVHSVEPVTP